jgi:hypothetical protein
MRGPLELPLVPYIAPLTATSFLYLTPTVTIRRQVSSSASVRPTLHFLVAPATVYRHPLPRVRETPTPPFPLPSSALTPVRLSPPYRRPPRVLLCLATSHPSTLLGRHAAANLPLKSIVSNHHNNPRKLYPRNPYPPTPTHTPCQNLTGVREERRIKVKKNLGEKCLYFTWMRYNFGFVCNFENTSNFEGWMILDVKILEVWW